MRFKYLLFFAQELLFSHWMETLTKHLSIHKNNRLFHRLVRGVNFIRRVQTRQSNLLWPLALAKPDETAAAVR